MARRRAEAEQGEHGPGIPSPGHHDTRGFDSKDVGSSGLIKKDAPDGAFELLWVDPRSIHPNENNWRLHPDDQKTLVGDAIDDPEIGWAGACLYNKRTGEFVDGHLRREHAIARGMDRIPVLVGDWSPEKQAAIHALLDISAGMAKVDIPKLLAMVGKAKPPSERAGEILKRMAERHGVKFPDRESDDEAGDDADDGADDGPSAADRTEALRSKWGVEAGQVWGFDSADGRKHRIAVGDSSRDGTMANLFGAAKPDLIVTSPPYADQRDYSGDLPPWDDLMRGVFAAMPTHADTQMLVNFGNRYEEGEYQFYWYEWVQWMRSRGWRMFGWYIWDQKRGLPGDFHGRLAPSHENVFHFNKNAIDPNKIVPNRTAGSVEGVPGLRDPDGNVPRYKVEYIEKNPWIIADFKIPSTVISAERDNNSGTVHLHPAVYPVGFARQLIDAYASDGCIVADPFGGSLTTILAAEKSGHRGYASEVNPGYVAIGLERLAEAGFRPNLVR